MIKCANCGKELTTVPKWLEGTKADFVCNNCPKRQIKNITQLDISEILGTEAVVDKNDPEALNEEDTEEDDSSLPKKKK